MYINNLESSQASNGDIINVIKNVISYNSELKNSIIVVKLPNEMLESQALMTNFADNLKVITGGGASVVVVHDCPTSTSKYISSLGINPEYLKKLDSIDKRATSVTEMLVAGHVNKSIAALLCKTGCNAIGLSGKDCNLLDSRSSLVSRRINKEVHELEFISKPVMLNIEFVHDLLHCGMILVIAPIAFDQDFITYILDPNITAGFVATELDAKHLVFLTSLGKMKTSEGCLTHCDIQDIKSLYQNGEIDSRFANIIESVQQSITSEPQVCYVAESGRKDALLLTLFSEKYSTKIII